eukprot:s6221_g5.t1
MDGDIVPNTLRAVRRPVSHPPAAEQMAHDFLTADSISIWSSIRQVIQHLHFEPAQRWDGDQAGHELQHGQCFRLGAFFRGSCRAC